MPAPTGFSFALLALNELHWLLLHEIPCVTDDVSLDHIRNNSNDIRLGADLVLC